MKDQLRKLIAQGKTQKAILQLLDLTNQLEETDLHNEVILQSGRFERYEKANRQGLSSFEEEGISIAKINTALLSIIDRLPEEELTPALNQEQQTDPIFNKPFSGKWWRWVVGLGLLIAIPAGIAELSGYSLRDFFSNGNMDAFSVTVLVHGKKGRDDRILRNQGKVILDIGDTREEENINAKGEATFKGLSTSFRGKKALISIDHPQPYFPTNRNAEYVLEKNKAIYLEVELQGLNKIQGRVLDFETEKPLDSVRVSVQNIAEYTDAFGWYELSIPPEKQAKFIKVTFYKKGYEMESIDSIAPHTQQEIGISLKK